MNNGEQWQERFKRIVGRSFPAPMTPNEYQSLANETAIYPREHGLPYVTLGLLGEAGEVANQVKKTIRDDGGEITETRKAKILDELGDVAWYLAQTCTELGVSLSSVLAANVSKLQARKNDGHLHGDQR